MPFLIFIVTFLGMTLVTLAWNKGNMSLLYVGITVTLGAFILAALVSTMMEFTKYVDFISIETKDSIEKITVSCVDKDEANDNIIKIINSNDSVNYYQIDDIETFYKEK